MRLIKSYKSFYAINLFEIRNYTFIQQLQALSYQFNSYKYLLCSLFDHVPNSRIKIFHYICGSRSLPRLQEEKDRQTHNFDCIECSGDRMSRHYCSPLSLRAFFGERRFISFLVSCLERSGLKDINSDFSIIDFLTITKEICTVS